MCAVVILTLVFAGMRLHLNREAERRITAVLTKQYPGQVVAVQRRSDSTKRWDYQWWYQVCFDLLLDGSQRRTAMVVGDADGGSFSFRREYPSMQACKADFQEVG